MSHCVTDGASIEPIKTAVFIFINGDGYLFSPSEIKKERELRPFKQIKSQSACPFPPRDSVGFTVTSSRLSLEFFGKATKILKYLFQPKHT